MGRKPQNLKGEKFGSWLVLKRSDRKAHGRTLWTCKCDCGTISDVDAHALTTSGSRGCKKCVWQRFKHPSEDTSIPREYKKHPKYMTWYGMKSRCNNKNHPEYHLYGERGIKVCDEWNNDFSAWYEYVSKLDHFGEPGRTMDRIDNNKGYQPGNIRWATAKEQVHNSRPNSGWRKKKSRS